MMANDTEAVTLLRKLVNATRPRFLGGGKYTQECGCCSAQFETRDAYYAPERHKSGCAYAEASKWLYDTGTVGNAAQNGSTPATEATAKPPKLPRLTPAQRRELRKVSDTLAEQVYVPSHALATLRTMRILRERGLLSGFNTPSSFAYGFRLTDKGRSVAKRLFSEGA